MDWLHQNRRSRAWLAAQLGLTRQAIYRWDKIPSDYLRTIQNITDIPGHKLDPELAKVFR